MSARRGTWLRPYSAACLVFLYAPVFLLPVFAFNDAAIIAFPLKGFSTRNFEQLWATEALHAAVINSLMVGVASSVLATILGLCAARASTRYDFPFKKPLIGFIMLPLVLPEIIIAVALLVVLIQLGLDLSLWTVILGHVLICTPFAIAILSSAFQSLDQSLEEASYDLGESRFGTFRRVTFPLVLPGVIASLLISFTISLDEFIIAFFLTGIEPTLPVYIWSQLRFTAKLPSVMALGFLMLLVSLALLASAEFFRRRANRRQGMGTAGGPI
ncbi:Inner membrane ABC transporter permease protein YdcV [Defluviimonas aquaemixtae]|uniref:Inner membrane ABC transporter permease protein YdcV n=1 Tax=Albidovulum aquaemixtae TaxID=1542388 RepID=A0A2R8B3U3_9RHOB|nr:ABC transporter permease [Defluviimonas aquaemixtae]SPH17267.1 Inner membrane ABC transporter permease protein YdcV [Defluviimonas aquaemixtae]